MSDWMPDSAERAFLEARGATPREAILALGFLDGAPMWRIGEMSGYGAGRDPGPEKQRHCWQSAVSRGARRGGQVIPRIRSLMDMVSQYRQRGAAPRVAGEDEILQRLSDVVRSSQDARVISAAKELLAHHRRTEVPSFSSPDRLPRIVDACCTHDNVLFQTLGIAAGRHFKLGVPAMKNWEVPDDLKTLSKLMDRSGLTPREILEVLVHPQSLQQREKPQKPNGRAQQDDNATDDYASGDFDESIFDDALEQRP